MTKVDPRFRRAGKKATQVNVDGRFKAMFEDEEFVKPVKVDKYGRKVVAGRERKDLERFYRLDAEDMENMEDKESMKDEVSMEDRESMEEEESGLGSDADSQDSDTDSDSDQKSDYVMDNVLSNHPLVAQDIPTGEATHRLALVNIDWDQIRADDIYTLLHGFKPATGTIISVTIWPSEFGKERMQREAIEGPPRELFERAETAENSTSDSALDDSDADFPQEEEEDFDSVALRKYQLERLRYYYAVIKCDSAITAAHIYRNCDGSEFEKSANFIDLRYIPDATVFDGNAKDHCTELPKNYHAKPDLVTAALQMSKVELTWDADDCERTRVTSRPRMDQEEADLRAYLASTDEDEENDADADKYRQLLLSGGDSNVFGKKQECGDELQITFASALKPGNEDDLHMEATFTEEASKENADMTPYDKYMARRKARKDSSKERKEQGKSKPKDKRRKRVLDASLELLVDGDVTDDEERKDVAVNVDDERFKAVFEEPAFALDPSNPSFKRTKGMDRIIKERQRRIHK